MDGGRPAVYGHPVTAEMNLSSPDELCDLTADIVTTRKAADARDKRIESALSVGCDYCSACGRVIKSQAKATRVTFTDGSAVAWLGSECIKKIG